MGGVAGTRRRRIIDQAAIDAAVAKSAFAQLPVELRRRLLHDARPVSLASKEYFNRIGQAPRGGLIVNGFVRILRTHSDGRELTVTWGHPGDLVGLTGLIRPPAWTAVQAVTETTFVELPLPVVRELATTDARVAWALTQFAGMLLLRAVDEIVIFALGDLRSRIEWRILELACRNPPGTPLIAQISQDQLAQAVGAARPSVARVLKALREEGSIRTLRGGILVVKPEALAPPQQRVEAV